MAEDEIIRVKNGNEVLEPKTFNDVVEFIQYYNGITGIYRIAGWEAGNAAFHTNVCQG